MIFFLFKLSSGALKLRKILLQFTDPGGQGFKVYGHVDILMTQACLTVIGWNVCDLLAVPRYARDYSRLLLCAMNAFLAKLVIILSSLFM